MTKAEVLAMLDAAGYVRATVVMAEGSVQGIRARRANGTAVQLGPGALWDAMTEPLVKRTDKLRAGRVVVFNVDLSSITECESQATADTNRATEEFIRAEKERAR